MEVIMLKRIFIVIGMIIIILISYYAGMLSTMEITVAKDYAEIIISENEIVGKEFFLEPKGKYEVLKQIEEPIRKTIALYMEANNLKLCSGKHRFNRVSGTLDEYLNKEFKFEKINGCQGDGSVDTLSDY